MRRLAILLSVLLAIFLYGCTGTPTNNPPPAVSVNVTPASAQVRAGDTQQFSATVSGTSNTAVSWMVGGVLGGNATLGTITAAGLYTAPATLPNPNPVTVQAASVADASKTGSSAVTLENPIPVVSSINPNVIGVGPFTLTVTGSKFVSGAIVNFGSTKLTPTSVSSTQLVASGTAAAADVGTVTVSVTNPDPGSATSGTLTASVVSGTTVTQVAAVRFLEQATFGPTPQAVAQLQATGFNAFLTGQFNQPASTYPDPQPTDMSLTPVRQQWFVNALTGADQLRGRVAFALGQIWVISGNKITVPQAFVPYLRLLANDAFGNYRQIMQDVTLSPAMGHYLDMVNNDKGNGTTTHANENYARELMQLFTLGTFRLNQDGTLQKDAQGNPIATYSQADVQAFARAFTGWTYPTQPGHTLTWTNPPYWNGPMEAVEAHHDTAAKALLRGTTLPAGQTALQDLNGALDDIFNHPNLPSFISKQLIEHLVTSNPSPQYVKRVADVFVSGTFNGFGSGQRGDLKAVIAATLLDAEARRGDSLSTANPVDGKLREPILLMTDLARAFNVPLDANNNVVNTLINSAGNMGEPVLFPGSVFNVFPPDFQIPDSSPPLLGPEFAIQTTATTLVRINFVSSMVFGNLGGTTVDFSRYSSVAGDLNQLLTLLNNDLLHGTMSSSMQGAVTTALNTVPAGSGQALARAKMAAYLVISSSQYQVER